MNNAPGESYSLLTRYSTEEVITVDETLSSTQKPPMAPAKQKITAAIQHAKIVQQQKSRAVATTQSPTLIPPSADQKQSKAAFDNFFISKTEDFGRFLLNAEYKGQQFAKAKFPGITHGVQQAKEQFDHVIDQVVDKGTEVVLDIWRFEDQLLFNGKLAQTVKPYWQMASNRFAATLSELQQGVQENTTPEFRAGIEGYFTLGGIAARGAGVVAKGAAVVGKKILYAVEQRAQKRAAKQFNYGANSAVSGVSLKKSLASEQQLEGLRRGKFTDIAGPGTKVVLRDAPRLAATYGGKPSDWNKITSYRYIAPDGKAVETHAYRNSATGRVVEPKTIINHNQSN